MAPDPFEGNHRQPRAVYKYWARTSSTPLVSSSLSSSSSTEWWKSVVAAVTTVTHSANCAVLGSFRYGVNCSDKFQQFLVGRGRPCDHAAKAFLVAQYLVRLWIHFLRQFERDFWKNFAQFLRDWVDSGS